MQSININKILHTIRISHVHIYHHNLSSPALTFSSLPQPLSKFQYSFTIHLFSHEWRNDRKYFNRSVYNVIIHYSTQPKLIGQPSKCEISHANVQKFFLSRSYVFLPSISLFLSFYLFHTIPFFQSLFYICFVILVLLYSKHKTLS